MNLFMMSRSNEATAMQGLLKVAMRFKPRQTIVGEVRDGESQTLLKAWNGARKPMAQLLLLLLLASVCSGAFAGEAMPWDSGLKKFGDALTGTTAMYISLLAFAGCMFGLIWGGEMSDVIKKMVIIVMAGSGLVGAASLAKNLLGVQVTGAVIDSAQAHVDVAAILLRLLSALVGVG
ncbi:Flp pilus assembly complex ATPase component TadA [Xanthomonas campestris pv. campestris]|uniref:TrbC/VirB2 family protein n=1 Tax=Xanthomonas campestris TaxID=339 RepID=UPI001E3C0DEC|nr:TrbC/VirB2 family protein [Xanthomonas campestris]MCD0253093.1 Flp pilus assembly complex ATPase component TadA [Xanthomonas campestris pv. campestris]